MKQGILFAFLTFLADQISKICVLQFFTDHASPVTVTPFFNLVLAWNKGVSFSMFYSDSNLTRWLLTLFALLICVVVVYWMKQEKNQLSINCFGLILGGALGNIVDRIRFGAVVDFLDFHAKGYHWPAFNVSDSAICIGAAIILIWTLFFEKKSKAQIEGTKEEKE